MPQRSNEFQAIVHAVRLETATDGVTVTESKMLPSTDGGEREVDIVVEGEFDGDPVVTSIEVIDRKRKADVTWVEQMIAKHKKLPTNKLILISSSGFFEPALVAVAAENGTVEALQPEVVLGDDGEPVVQRFTYTSVTLRPEKWELVLVYPEGVPVVQEMTDLPNTVVCGGDGVEVGTLHELAIEAVRLPFVGKGLYAQAEAEPELQAKDAFTVVFVIEGCGYFLPFLEDGAEETELHRIVVLKVTGGFKFYRELLEAGVAKLGGRMFGSSVIEGTRAVWVRRPNGEIGLRALEGGESVPEPKFKALLDIEPPPEWADEDPERMPIRGEGRFRATGGGLTALS